jgi:hypothetical protein
LTAGSEETVLAPVSEDPWLIAGTLAFQWAKEMAESRSVNQGFVEVEKRILDGPVLSFVELWFMPSGDAN